MIDMPDIEERVSSKELTRRAWIALGISEVAFAFFTVLGGIAAVGVSDPEEMQGWGDLALAVVILLAGAASVLVALPIAVHTVGRLTVRKTEGWPSGRAGLAHLVVGLALGSVVASMVVVAGLASPAAAFLAFALPPGLAGWVANTLVPYAARHGWLVLVSWALAIIPILTSVWIVGSIFTSGVPE